MSASVAFNSAAVQVKVVSSFPVLVDKLVPCVITGGCASTTSEIVIEIIWGLELSDPSETVT